MSLSDASSLLPRFEAALQFARGQVERLLQRAPERFATWTSEGVWQFADDNATAWCRGFLPGLMWVLHEATGEAAWRHRAEQYSRLVEPLRVDPGTSGLGMIFYHGTHRRWYEATLRDRRPSEVVCEILFDAGRTLAKRFQDRGGYLHAVGGPATLSIETMMDVPLLLWTATHSSDEDLLDLACRHCATTRRYLVRGDGSVAAEAQYDTDTGECLGPLAGPGYRGDSCWSRGVAWGIYGFAEAGRILSFGPWLQTARLCAQFLIERLSGEPVPPWDFDAPADVPGGGPVVGAGSTDGGQDARPPIRDSSAAAVAAAALLTLADAEQTIGTEEARQRRHLQEVALRVLDALCEPHYLAADDPDWQGILKAGVGALPAGLAVNESLIWGDFFFVEALHLAIRALRSSRR